MNKITNEQFKTQIEQWQKIIIQNNITLVSGEPVPNKFFHVFLGVGYSTFKKMVSGKDTIREIQPYTAKTIRFVNKLEHNTFLDEIRLAILEYNEIYS